MFILTQTKAAKITARRPFVIKLRRLTADADVCTADCGIFWNYLDNQFAIYKILKS